MSHVYVDREVERHGYTIRIVADTDYQRDWDEDDSLFLVAFCRDFYVKRDGFDKEAFMDEERLASIKKDYNVFPLRAYIHSGIALSLGASGYPFDCPWDSGWIGFVLVSKEEWPDDEKACAAAASLVAEANDVLSGNVWGFEVEDAAGDVIESCWGFVGDPDYPFSEATDIVDHLHKKDVLEERRANFCAAVTVLANPSVHV